jgi:glycosyltransferase involved in cell wall biosynthesis
LGILFIDSVLNEACRKDVEIIIVNDGRERSTIKLADRYPVKVIDGNGHGPVAARNIGVQISRGE